MLITSSYLLREELMKNKDNSKIFKEECIESITSAANNIADAIEQMDSIIQELEDHGLDSSLAENAKINILGACAAAIDSGLFEKYSKQHDLDYNLSDLITDIENMEVVENDTEGADNNDTEDDELLPSNIRKPLNPWPDPRSNS